mmetsp:Transcript_18597/g.61314  ORF Transcript_18597/g.61314 Transcript_18597/m.61314 type:complete len:89 (+) Transcript_18597:87-353(+)
MPRRRHPTTKPPLALPPRPLMKMPHRPRLRFDLRAEKTHRLPKQLVFLHIYAEAGLVSPSDSLWWNMRIRDFDIGLRPQNTPTCVEHS